MFCLGSSQYLFDLGCVCASTLIGPPRPRTYTLCSVNFERQFILKRNVSKEVTVLLLLFTPHANTKVAKAITHSPLF